MADLVDLNNPNLDTFMRQWELTRVRNSVIQN